MLAIVGQGVEIALVVATRGESGWFGEPHAYPGEEVLGRIHEEELRKASQAPGISQLAFLDYLDGELDRANTIEATARIVRLIRQFQPQVVLTFGPEGLYGHPDHIAISQLTTSAVVSCEMPTIRSRPTWRHTV